MIAGLRSGDVSDHRTYTERDIYTAIVQTAVPIALTAEETALLVADLLSLAAEMPHDGPAGVFHAWQHKNKLTGLVTRSYPFVIGMIETRNARSAVLARQAAEYPSLKGGV